MQIFEYIIVKIFYEVLRRIPFKVSLLLAYILAKIVEYVVRYRRKLVMESLSAAFPDYDDKHIKATVHEVYYNFCMLWIELLQSWRLNGSFFKKYFSIYNWEVVEQAQLQNQGLIMVTGHFGNFEWMGYYLATRHQIFHAIMRKLKNPYVNKLIVQTRNNHGVHLIYTKGALKKGLTVLKKGETLGIVGDQDAGESGIFVNFLGKPASTATGTALFHLRTGAPIIFCACLRRGWGRYHLFFERIPDAPSRELTQENIFTITQAHTSCLERWVRRYPGHYFWTHKRWKTKPKFKEERECTDIKDF